MSVRVVFRSCAACVSVLVMVLAFSNVVRAERVAMSSLDQKGYVFLHPMFRSLPWNQTLRRLDLVLPDALSNLRIRAFDVSRGVDTAVAVFIDTSSRLYVMPVLYEELVAPCFDHALTFDPPAHVALPGFTLSAGRPLYVLRDSVYSTDSVRIAVPSPSAPLHVLVATIQTAGPSVTTIDTLPFGERRTGQQIASISGATSSSTHQDTGLWVCGSGGLVRYVPYVNGTFGAEQVRDLSDGTVSVTHTNGTYAVTLQGGIYRRNTADTFFTIASTASGALRRVYHQGAVGDNGLFKENQNTLWKRDTTFGTVSYRYANFIRRPGGFGVELLDSTWGYSIFTYRDTSTRIAATQPASLSTNINGTPFLYNGQQQLDITVMLDDPDSNFSDYSLHHVRGTAATSLKNDGTYSIAPLSDSADCHIGSLKMTAGRIRLALTGSAFQIMHDCGLGALDPTCLACYWKNYDFQVAMSWRDADTIKIQTGQHLLRIVNSASVTLAGHAAAFSGSGILKVRFASGQTRIFRLPVKTGAGIERIALHDLRGRMLAAVRLAPGQRMVTLPALGQKGILVFSCSISDGTRVIERVPVLPK